MASDANLIKGAAAAYKDFSNVPGMYAGLDKVIQAGEKITKKAAAFALERQKEKEKKEQEKKQQDATWAKNAAPVYQAAGSFLDPSGTEYKDVVTRVEALKEDWIKAGESNDAQEIARINLEFSNIQEEVADHKSFREEITDPIDGLSDWVTGDNKTWLTSWVAEEFTIEYDEDKDSETFGKKLYVIGDEKKTMEQIKEMAGLKDSKPFNAYGEQMEAYNRMRKLPGRDNILQNIRNNILPQDTNGLRAFLNDKGFGNGQNFTQVLQQEENKKDIIEILKKTIFDKDSPGVITDDEYDNFIEAIVSPNGEFWNIKGKDDVLVNGGAQGWERFARQIVTEQLTNAIINEYNREDEEEEDLTIDEIVSKATNE